MSVTQEDGGRLNAFAREPKIELIQQGTSRTNYYRLVIFGGTLIVVGLIVFSLNIS